MWTAIGKRDDLGRFGDLPVSDVLYEADGPKLFVSVVNNLVFLVYESTFDLSDELVRFLAVPTTGKTIQHLIDGTLTVLEALDQKQVWSIDQKFQGDILEAVMLREGIYSVPDGFKPEPGVRLRPDHYYA
ncbi:hypothetical protein [Burkholderia sp. RF2-non_BP3]|uniref:hypothetical protein n=1 Tax=Burkholderia sp. RF2-non_BP3 TaxID=1637844 RepID=UPI0012E3D0EF|nr:hypothetical protein [Burkholderia sp. RF2-non_BP3]